MPRAARGRRFQNGRNVVWCETPRVPLTVRLCMAPHPRRLPQLTTHSSPGCGLSGLRLRPCTQHLPSRDRRDTHGTGVHSCPGTGWGSGLRTQRTEQNPCSPHTCAPACSVTACWVLLRFPIALVSRCGSPRARLTHGALSREGLGGELPVQTNGSCARGQGSECEV